MYEFPLPSAKILVAESTAVGEPKNVFHSMTCAGVGVGDGVNEAVGVVVNVGVGEDVVVAVATRVGVRVAVLVGVAVLEGVLVAADGVLVLVGVLVEVLAHPTGEFISV